MHKALFGLLTVAALVAVGVVIGNRSMVVMEAAAAKDKAPMTAVANKSCGCCSTSEAMASKKTSCCDESVAVGTACTGKAAMVSTGGCCDATVMTSAKKGSCCEGEATCCGGEGTCGATETVAKKECKADGSCCAHGEGACCGDKETTEVKAEKEISTSAGKTGSCPCQKASQSEASHQ